MTTLAQVPANDPSGQHGDRSWRGTRTAPPAHTRPGLRLGELRVEQVRTRSCTDTPSPFDFDRPHAAAIAVNVQLVSRVRVSATSQDAAGFPIAPLHPEVQFSQARESVVGTAQAIARWRWRSDRATLSRQPRAAGARQLVAPPPVCPHRRARHRGHHEMARGLRRNPEPVRSPELPRQRAHRRRSRDSMPATRQSPVFPGCRARVSESCSRECGINSQRIWLAGCGIVRATGTCLRAKQEITRSGVNPNGFSPDYLFLLVLDAVTGQMMTCYDDAMRTIIELPEDQLEALDGICRRDEISRAEAIRQAVDTLIGRSGAGTSERAFGLWRNRPRLDGLRLPGASPP